MRRCAGLGETSRSKGRRWAGSEALHGVTRHGGSGTGALADHLPVPKEHYKGRASVLRQSLLLFGFIFGLIPVFTGTSAPGAEHASTGN